MHLFDQDVDVDLDVTAHVDVDVDDFFFHSAPVCHGAAALLGHRG